VKRRPKQKRDYRFVARVTQQGGPDFVPPAERIATFDNDGTLWAEQPATGQTRWMNLLTIPTPERLVSR
jgi:hypothetical protein